MNIKNQNILRILPVSYTHLSSYGILIILIAMNKKSLFIYNQLIFFPLNIYFLGWIIGSVLFIIIPVSYTHLLETAQNGFPFLPRSLRKGHLAVVRKFSVV